MASNDIWTRLEGAISDWSRELDEAAASARPARQPTNGAHLPPAEDLAPEAFEQEVQLLADRVEALARHAGGAIRPLKGDARQEFASRFRPLFNAMHALEAIVAGSSAAFDDGEAAASTNSQHALEQEIEGVLAARDEARREIEQLRRELDDMRENMGHARPANEPPFPWEELVAFDESGRRLRFGAVLVRAGIITQEQLERAMHEQAQAPHRRLGSVLVNMGLVTDELVAAVLAAQLQLPYVQVQAEAVEPAAANALPEHIALRYSVVPLRLEADALLVATANPMDLIALEDLERATGRTIRFAVAARDGLPEAVRRAYGK